MRPSWDDTWMAMAREFASRSLCVRSRVAAVIVTSDNRVASVGYNGPPQGLGLTEPCTAWCPRGNDTEPGTGRQFGLSCLTVHAEINALMRADWRDMQGGTIYGTRTPCEDCAKVIANSGLARAVFHIAQEDSRYAIDAIHAFLDSAGLTVVRGTFA
jgi:dCMP deaminase